jgi:glycerophosphoryl diester phosphodiesterase
MAGPKLVAHRGYARAFPENTLAAVEAAIQAGAQWVEIDVQLTADGFPVLFHDRTTDRMCGESGTIGERTLAQVRSLACHEPGRFGERYRGEGIASLGAFAQILRRHPHVHAFVEVKRVSIDRFGPEFVLERVMSTLAPAREQCTLISFSVPFLVAARRAHTLPLGAVFDHWDERAKAAEVRPEFVFVDVTGLPAEGTLQQDHARIAVYEVAEPTVARALAARGVEFVETFAIAEMVAALGRPSEAGA